MSRPRVRLRDIGPWYTVGLVILKPLTAFLCRARWSGTENVPPRGGVIIAANHISLAEPALLADFVVFGCRRIARVLAKESLFRGGGLVARVMRGAEQIPVHRGTTDASVALSSAVAALQRGECVVIYPEGTVTRDPGTWPMLARTGVARLALLSGAPVVPVAQWGAQEIHTYGKKGVHVLPRKTHTVVAGPPVDLSAHVLEPGAEPSVAQLRAVTDLVMHDITRLLEGVRGESAPAVVHVPDDARRSA